MRKIVQFQVVLNHSRIGDHETTHDPALYALTEDGVLWTKPAAGGDWVGIEPPGDGEPFKVGTTQERLLKRLARGGGFPQE